MLRFVALTVIGVALALPAQATKPTPPPAQNQAQGQHQWQAQGQSQGQSQGQLAIAGAASASASKSEAHSMSFSSSGSMSDASATGGSADNSMTNSITFEGTKTRDNTPDVALGGLFPSAVCMGVANGGVSAPGFGIGAGKSYRDHECDKRETARSFAALGYTREALLILCSTEAAKVLDTCPAAVPAPTTDLVILKAPQGPDPTKVEEQKKQVGQLEVK